MTPHTDSTQAQIFDHLHRAVFPLDTTYYEEVRHVDDHGQTHAEPTVRMLHLPLNSPLSQTLLERARAPAERLQRPLVTYIRDDTLLSARQLRAALGLAPTAPLANVYEGGWAERVEEAIAPLPLGTKARWKGSANTVVWVNTGTSWARGSFPGVTHTQKMVEAYRAGVRVPACSFLAAVGG